MDGFSRRTEAKQQAILDAAQRQFFAAGVREATIAAIAKEAGVSQVSIYNYFGSKNALLREVMLRYMNASLQQADALLASSQPFPEKLKELLSLKSPAKLPFGHNFTETVPWDDPKIQEAYREFAQTKALPFIFRLVDQGKAEGCIHPSVTHEAAAAYVGAIMSVLTQPEFLKRDGAFKESLQQLFFYGLVGKR